MLAYILLGVIVLFVLSGVFIVDQQSVALIERLGKFNREVHAGISWRIPIVDQIVSTVSLKQEQLVFDVDTKTKDNVFVTLEIALQHVVTDAFSAYYKLAGLDTQLQAYAANAIRAYVPSKTLDVLFEEQDELSAKLTETLSVSFKEFGILIPASLISDIEVDEKVEAAMNTINAEQRLREAAIAKAEADKLTKIKEAEGEAEAKRLQGEGIAAQRKAIADGLAASAKAIGGEDPLDYVLLTQYLDTLAGMAETSESKVIFMPSGLNALDDLKTQIIAATEAK